MSSPIPIIAIVGKPNVGKSMLFNSLIGKRHAIVSSVSGTTRDRIHHEFNCNGYQTILVDTGGLQTGQENDLEADIQGQAKTAIKEADIIIFTVDITHELNSDDFAAVDILRKSKKPVILVANKSDNPHLEQKIYNFYELGFGDPIAISAIHKVGIEILRKKIVKALKELNFSKTDNHKRETSSTINICILGKPNAGKSSLINTLIGANKIIVSEIPGTTRDTLDIKFNYENEQFNFIDTAGIRRPGKIQKGIEKFSILRAIKAIERTDIVILLIDGTAGITHQDCHILEDALEQKKGLIIAINKIDLLEKEENYQSRLIAALRRKFAFIPWAPVIFISVRNKKNIDQILPLIKGITLERQKLISDAELNNFIHKIIQKHLPASTKLQKPVFIRAQQTAISPPKFVLFFKNAANLHFSYERYLENELRKAYGFNGTAINIKFKQTQAPASVHYFPSQR